jgi:hypothetical protein
MLWRHPQLWSGLESGKTPWDLQHPEEDVWSYFRSNPEVEQVGAACCGCFLLYVADSCSQCVDWCFACMRCTVSCGC